MFARSSTSPYRRFALSSREESGASRLVVGSQGRDGGVWKLSALIVGGAESVYGSSLPPPWSGLTHTRAPRASCHSERWTCHTLRQLHPIGCPARTCSPSLTVAATCQ